MATKKAAVLIDLSGTLHIEDSAIPRAAEALQRLRESGKPIKFVTNTTKESIGVLHSRLSRCELNVEKKDMFTSLLAARRLIESRKLRPMFLLEPEALEDFSGIDTSNPNAVVVGLAPSEFHYERLNDAFKLLLEADASLIAINKSRYYKQASGLSLAAGPFVETLEYCSGVKSEIVGKPSQAFFHLAISSFPFEVDVENTVMIGDDVNDDVIGAIQAGMKGILVKTGKYREGDEMSILPDRRNCVESFSEAVDLICSGTVA